MKRTLTLAALVAAFAFSGLAQDRPMQGSPQGVALDGYGYAHYTSLHTPKALTDAPVMLTVMANASDPPQVGYGMHPQARSAIIWAKGGTIVWRDDNIPPTAEGLEIPDGGMIILRDRPAMEAFRFISAETLGAEAATQTCAGWGLSSPVGAWSCAVTTITRTASAADLAITNTFTPTAGKTYKVVWTVATLTAGTFRISLGGTGGHDYHVTAGTWTEYLTAADTTALTITASAAAAGTIDAEVSVKEMQGAAELKVRYGW